MLDYIMSKLQAQYWKKKKKKLATDYEYRITKVSDGFISTDWLNHNLL